MNKPKRRFKYPGDGLEIFALVILLLSLFAAIRGIANLRAGRASESWPTTQGTIRTSEVRVTKTFEGPIYKVDIKYKYRANGEDHWGDRLHFQGVQGEYIFDFRDEADSLAREYPLGRLVTVYYDPKSPERSTLNPGIRAANYWDFGGPIVGVGIFIFIFSLVFVGYRRSKRQPSATTANTPSEPDSR